MATTQDHLPILDIKDGIIFLRDGGAVVVLKTSAVNFGLLSGEEQIAIIGSFAQMLNSLSFPIQIIIRSSRLDISAYLRLLDKALQSQTNPLLATLMAHYRQFVQSLIKDNEVLDKSFYVVVPLSYLELGLAPKEEDRLKKAENVLLPRRDQIIRQLARVGLKADQISTENLLKHFYEIYNPVFNTPTSLDQIDTTPASLPQTDQILKQPVTTYTPPANQPAQPPKTMTQRPTNQTITPPSPSRSHPFVVEELSP